MSGAGRASQIDEQQPSYITLLADVCESCFLAALLGLGIVRWKVVGSADGSSWLALRTMTLAERTSYIWCWVPTENHLCTSRSTDAVLESKSDHKRVWFSHEFTSQINWIHLLIAGAVKNPILHAINFELTLSKSWYLCILRESAMCFHLSGQQQHQVLGGRAVEPRQRLHLQRRRHPNVHRRAKQERCAAGFDIRVKINQSCVSGKRSGVFLCNWRKTVSPAGSITMEDLISVLPFGGTFDLVQLRGSTLRKMFEHSVKRYGLSTGEFLQVSGTFDFTLFPSVFDRLFSDAWQDLMQLFPAALLATLSRAALICFSVTSFTAPVYCFMVKAFIRLNKGGFYCIMKHVRNCIRGAIFLSGDSSIVLQGIETSASLVWGRTFKQVVQLWWG